MIVITTRSYPPELGGMQSLMGGLAIHLNQLHPIKVLANSYEGDESYDKKNSFETHRMGGFKILKKYRKFNLLKEVIKNNSVKAIIADHWKSIELITDNISNQIPISCLIHGKEINHPIGSFINKRSINSLTNCCSNWSSEYPLSIYSRILSAPALLVAITMESRKLTSLFFISLRIPSSNSCNNVVNISG